MHELTLLADLMKKIDSVVREQQAERATKVTVRLGALAHISAGHFREHFDQSKVGTVAENAELEVITETDETDPNAQEILLDSLEVE